MKEAFQAGLMIGVIAFLIGVIAWGAYGAGAGALTNTLVRDCELAGVHVVDNDTVIVCRVMKRDPTPEVETKPEEYL